MKNNLHLLSVLASTLLLSACSSDATPAPSDGTAGSSSTAGSPATAGASAAAGSGAAGAPITAGSGGTSAGGSSAAGASTGGAPPGTGGASVIGGAPGTGGAGGSTGPQHWVGTWASSQYLDSNKDNAPPAGVSLAGSVLRQITHASIGGSKIRVQFSNLVGDGPLTINAAHVALCKKTPLVDGSIDATTDKALTFSGMPNVTIAKGQEVWSDGVDFAVPPLGNITVTAALGSVPGALTEHSGARTNSYIQTGSTTVDAANMTTNPTPHWWFLSAIDVMADASARAIVAIGDSITDGRGTDTDANNRWTDELAARLQANPATANVSVLNQGIGATNLAGSDPTTAETRFAHDVLKQSGVKYVIVLDGVNDIGGGAQLSTLQAAYQKLIAAAHGANALIYGGTITPFGAYAQYASHDGVRKAVNTYIKSGVFDGVIDFDAALTDGGDPAKLPDMYAKWAQTDGLHPNPTGYKKMGDTPDLTLFTK